jgi:hypothetical protein
MSISYGLVNSSDIFMGEWNGGILGPHGVSFFIAENNDWCMHPLLPI